MRPKALIYTGVADLPQFSVTKVASKNINKTAVFVMTLKRKIAYHIISVYLPSATIFFISLVTMFVHIKHVEATIMVHLTAMLVMYTLFQAISISLPKVRKDRKRILEHPFADLLHQDDRHLAALWLGPALLCLHSLHPRGVSCPEDGGRQ